MNSINVSSKAVYGKNPVSTILLNPCIRAGFKRSDVKNLNKSTVRRRKSPYCRIIKPYTVNLAGRTLLIDIQISRIQQSITQLAMQQKAKYHNTADP